jgi:hypothetical protein
MADNSTLGATNLPTDNQTQPPVAAAKPTVVMRPIILGDLTLASPTTFTTVGSAGAASAMPTPVGYITVMVGNAPFQIAYFNPA